MYEVEMTLLFSGKEIKMKLCKSIKEAQEFLTRIETGFKFVQKTLESYAIKTRAGNHGLVDADN